MMARITSCSGQAPLLRETRWPCADFYWHDAVLDSRASRRSVARARPSSRRVAGRHHALPDAPRAAASPANTRPAPHRPDHGPLRLMRRPLVRHQADRPVAHFHQTWLRWPRAHPSAPCHDPNRPPRNPGRFTSLTPHVYLDCKTTAGAELTKVAQQEKQTSDVHTTPETAQNGRAVSLVRSVPHEVRHASCPFPVYAQFVDMRVRTRARHRQTKKALHDTLTRSTDER